MKKALVTGSNGFLGSHLVKELLDNDVEVIAVVRNENSVNRLSIPSHLRIVYCELEKIHDLPSLISERDIDIFYHFAWEGSAGDLRKNIEVQFANIYWTIDSVKAASSLGCKRFVGAGSIMEKEMFFAVNDRKSGVSLNYTYGMAKLAAHLLSKSIAFELNMDHLWGIVTNAYGPGESAPRFINTTLRNLLIGGNLEFTEASQLYDFVFVTDVARAFFQIGEKGKPFNNYTIGSSEPRPLRVFIEEMISVVDSSKTPKFGKVPFSGTSLPEEAFSTESLERDTGFRPSVGFAEGIRSTVNWLLSEGDLK